MATDIYPDADTHASTSGLVLSADLTGRASVQQLRVSRRVGTTSTVLLRGVVQIVG